jgi:hypothetical protein
VIKKKKRCRKVWLDRPTYLFRGCSPFTSITFKRWSFPSIIKQPTTYFFRLSKKKNNYSLLLLYFLQGKLIWPSKMYKYPHVLQANKFIWQFNDNTTIKSYTIFTLVIFHSLGYTFIPSWNLRTQVSFAVITKSTDKAHI